MIAHRSLYVTRVLATLATQRGCRFTVGGESQSALIVFMPELFLPVIALHADAKCRELLGHPLAGLEFIPDPQAMLGVYAHVEPLAGDNDSAARLALFSHAASAVFGLEQDAQIETQAVFEAYADGLLAHIDRRGHSPWPTTTTSPR